MPISICCHLFLRRKVPAWTTAYCRITTNDKDSIQQMIKMKEYVDRDSSSNILQDDTNDLFPQYRKHFHLQWISSWKFRRWIWARWALWISPAWTVWNIGRGKRPRTWRQVSQRLQSTHWPTDERRETPLRAGYTSTHTQHTTYHSTS